MPRTSSARARLRALATVTVAVLTVADLVAEAVAPATVSGRVTDSFGDPVEGAAVSVTSVDPRSRTEQGAITDAAGRYTVTGAPAGVVVVVAVDSPAPWMHHQFWPGTADPDDAAALVLAAGDVRTGMDVVLPDAGGLAGTVQVPAGMDEYCVTPSRCDVAAE